MAGKGGARAGAGRPTQHALKQQQEKLKKAGVLLEEEKAADARKAYERMKAAADAGEPWAIRAMFEHTHGKAATRAVETPDTEITLVARLPVDGKIAIEDEMVDYADLVRAWRNYKKSAERIGEEDGGTEPLPAAEGERAPLAGVAGD